MINIIIIDNDPIVTTSLKQILETQDDFNIVALGHDGSDLLKLYTQYKPDIVLSDVRMKDSNGLEGGRDLLKVHPEAKIIFMSTFEDPEYIQAAQNIGAYSYIIKQDYETIINIIRMAHQDLKVFKASEVKEEALLSETEQEILELVAKGLNNKEIAQSIHLSEGTVRNYISTILSKLSLRDRTQLVIYYYKKLV